MDVVYVVKEEGDNDELRWSLRSLRNLPHGTVWIVGHKPKWCVNVEHLPTRPADTAWQDSTAKMWTAVQHPDVDDFYYFNDDFFVLQPTDTVPPMHKGPVSERYSRRYKVKGWNGADGMHGTWRLLEQWGYQEPDDYEVHVPLPVVKATMREVLARAFAEYPEINGLRKRTLYANVAGLGGERIVDVTVNKFHRDDPGSGAYVSTSELSFSEWEVGRQIRALFPDPSPYEEAP